MAINKNRARQKTKPVILVVDDLPQDIELLEAYLVPLGYEIVKAANGEDALGKLSSNQIDLILLDVIMPGMDGFEVTRRIRQDKKNRLMPIILVTTLKETEDRVKGIEAGCDDFISKPLDKMELFARIRSLLKVKNYNDLVSNDRKELESKVNQRTEELKSTLENLRQEITERKRAEEALKMSEQNFRNSMDESAIGIRIVDTDGKTIYGNRAILNIYGYDSIEELNATPVKKRYTAESYAEHQVRKGKRQRGEYVPSQYEISIVRKDGEIRHLGVLRKEVLWNDKTQFQVLYNDVTERKRMEEKNAYLASFPEINPRPVLELDQEGNLMYVNPAVKNIFPDLATFGVKHPFLADWAQVVAQLRGRKNVDSVIVREVTVGDSVFEQTISLVAINHIRVYGMDITERKKAQDSRDEQNVLLNALIDSPSDIFIFSLDKNFRYTAFNLNHRREMIKVWKTDIKIGMSMPDAINLPEIRAIALHSYNRVMGGEAFTEVGFQPELGIYFEFHWSPIRANDGEVIGITAFIRDITERKKTEEALRESEQRYRLLIDNANESISVAQDGLIKFVNQMMLVLFGRDSEQELIDRPYLEFIHPDDRHIVVENHRRRIKNEAAQARYDFRVITREGIVKWVEMNVALTEWQGKPATLNFLTDITERKQAEKERQELEEKAQMNSRLAAVGEMAAGIAHEINNPLTGVIGFSQLLLEKQNIPEDIKDELRIIANGGQRVADIVKRLLTFARQTKPIRTSVNLNELIDNTLKLREYVLKTANIEVVTCFDPDLPWSVVDPGQLQQVFLNLIVNAEQEMKKAHGKGTLTITTEKKENNIRMSFKDDGPGITKENLGHLFEPFFTTKAIGEGTGLGLSLSRSIILEHNGKINVLSEFGHGATFIIELPIIEALLSEVDALTP